MPIYVYRCDCGLRFERLTSFDADAPACPECGGATRKVPAGFSLGGQADAGLAKEQMPQTWRGVYNGNREYVTRMQKQWERRQQLEARHPELAGDQRPILAHEGRYHDAPLRAGDPVLGHGHGHSHAPAQEPAEPAAKSAPKPAAAPKTGGSSGPKSGSH
ncbi:FmdB family zinc ribbon protein [Pseudonocardia sp. H11422]|uniref:FmdB family zinc ribbon protein n=1 Tax=Pseudonocardia sp. H11422 TaxID=2835866 RepID=UPI001BDC785C|nr:zinc ribbon domain-containing protein [Pseudonocardia sp. H11422]